MSGQPAAVPEEWRALFEGRNVVFAGLPPAPPRAVSRAGKFFGRALVLVLAFGFAVGVSVGLASASGRWWIGLIMFLIIGWVATLLAVGIVGAIKVEREAEARRRARALEDPIGRLLPDRGKSRKAFRDPASYAGLFALSPRPALVFDTALVDVMQRDRFARSLAPRGRLPEPEVLETSSIPAGTAIFGAMLIFQSASFWMQGLAALRAGAPLSWMTYPGLVMVAVGIYMVVRDPWLRRKLNFPRIFGNDWIIGAGWIRDGKGEVWTVDDAILLVTLAGGGLEIRLIKQGRLASFYLPVIMGKSGTGRMKPATSLSGMGLRRRAKAVAADAARGAAESVGIEADDDAEIEMPTSKEPLRLLLSSWTYPEPRVDLAMRE
ncbi:MAG: hypothetical protein LW806_11920 [Planctomycetaceae bacterium]|nr:hypothetical protein [Planctomycetaceae bacterium]